jgi:hypothetical protein
MQNEGNRRGNPLVKRKKKNDTKMKGIEEERYSSEWTEEKRIPK